MMYLLEKNTTRNYWTQVGDNLELTILQDGKGQHIDLELGLQYGNVDNLTM